MRLAMWSGPRNISTAMMYAFAQRADFHTVDEPFYAAYLAATGLDHPMREAVLASQSTDPAQVVRGLLAPPPGGKPHVYHKHMTQHMIPSMPTDWLAECKHVFLLRHPVRVASSFAQKYDTPTADDIGFARQATLFQQIARVAGSPLVVNSADIRRDPRTILERLCGALGLDFDPAMLSWPKGGHPSDGIWAAHWYNAVHASTGFAGPEGPLPRLDGRLQALADAAMPHYEELAAHALT